MVNCEMCGGKASKKAFIKKYKKDFLTECYFFCSDECRIKHSKTVKDSYSEHEKSDYELPFYFFKS